MLKYTIRYQYADYSGHRTVFADDDAQAIAKMWHELERRGELGLAMAYKSAEIIRRDHVAGSE
jgi:hypothetical protein